MSFITPKQVAFGYISSYKRTIYEIIMDWIIIYFNTVRSTYQTTGEFSGKFYAKDHKYKE